MSDSDASEDERDDVPVGTARAPSSRIIDRVAAAEGTEPADLHARLYDVVDPEALDRVVERSSPGLTVAFRFNGYRVRVGGDGAVTVSAPVRK
ncbi:HalOD1 output domain-containing protein [Halobaculum rubrum]|uniref:HalOD1 output domain-containing protein n=1 Tax=Halobaculum rubrum TaxID=2872158 RepID=UPI001CA3F902|nr:HalOD1 output domain-containing protein [Halobaculum rubrum]QZY00624.1 hypothetical protein K6T25_05965 [Halobaculum rubrum]